MVLPSNYRKWPKRLAIPVVLLGSLWYAVFEWNSFDYLSSNSKPCYSATHVYYITRHQTLWEKVWRTYPNEYGTAHLYDNSGKLLYEGKTQFGGEELGPRWFPDHVSMGEDNNGKLWEAPLPMPPGDDQMSLTCYPVQTEMAIRP